ncbi:SLAF7 protein, partial [Anhinga anhinga]|nr:SLAF7 protein [Anhinga anhinga]
FSTSQLPSSLCILPVHTLPSAWLLSPVCTGVESEMIRAVGRSVTFTLPSTNEEAAAWSFHNHIILVLKFGNPPEASFFDHNYKTRLTFPNNGRALTISQLRINDTGLYTAQLSGQKITFTWLLHVYRELTVPTVTCMEQNCSADGCRYTLRCTASGSGSGNVSYSWRVGDLPQSEGPTVMVEEPPQDKPPLPPPPLLTCTARNPVSSSNATVTSPAALCAGNGHGKMR